MTIRRSSQAARYGLMAGDIIAKSGRDRRSNCRRPSMRRAATALPMMVASLAEPAGRISIPFATSPLAVVRVNGTIQCRSAKLPTSSCPQSPLHSYRGRNVTFPYQVQRAGRDVGKRGFGSPEKGRRFGRSAASGRGSNGGRGRDLQDAIKRLSILVPVSIGMILLLLYGMFGTMRNTLLAASVIPMAVVGGIFTLVLTGTPFSVSAAIGFVALFGISVMNGVIFLSYFRRVNAFGLERKDAIIQPGTTLLSGRDDMRCGLRRSAARGRATGSARRLAAPSRVVVVGGILLAPILILIILPVMIDVSPPLQR